MFDRAACDTWVERVLGVPATDRPRTQSSARGDEARAVNRRGIAYPKLLLRWRDAQAQAIAAMDRVGRDYLALPNVQADLRIAQVRAAVATLPGLIPAFGEELGDLLDRGINAGTDAGIATEALAVVGRYRRAIASASTLGAFEQFARKYVGELGVVPTLDGALAEIAAGLKASVPA